MNSQLETWGRLKRLTFIIDEQAKSNCFGGPTLSDPDERGLRYMASGSTTAELDELHRIVYELELVSPAYNWMDQPIVENPRMHSLSLDDIKLAITGVFRGDRFIDGLLVSKVNDHVVQNLCRRAYFLELTADHWPTHFSLNGDGSVPIGLVCRSIDGSMEGRTTGDRRACPSHQCQGWLVGVRWEDGQLLRICTEGWHFNPNSMELQVVGGGQISARFVSPPPLGKDPLPREQWPSKADLRKMSGWSIR